MPKEYNEDDDPSARRRKKKSFYAKLKKQEMEREAELAKKYRDRVGIGLSTYLRAQNLIDKTLQCVRFQVGTDVDPHFTWSIQVVSPIHGGSPHFPVLHCSPDIADIQISVLCYHVHVV